MGIWRYLAEFKQVTPEVDSEFWKMRFTVTAEAIDEEDEEELPPTTFDGVCEMREVTPGAEEGAAPARVYVGFKCKSGNQALFSAFVRAALKSEHVMMFSDPAEE